VAAFADSLQGAVHVLAMVRAALLRIVSNLRELGDVGTRREGFGARTAEHDAAQRVIG
jgi:hypothetical protein